MTSLDYALAYAAAGWQIFPVGLDKKPLVKWKDGATSDPSVVTDWWSSWPDAGIGLATGQRSGGIVVLDVDVKDGKNGRESLARLVLDNEDLPEGLESCTASGGSHLFFHTPHTIGNSRSKLGDGLDVRGDGGYVVLPSGPDANGVERYRWLNDEEPLELPDWLAKLMVAHSDAAATREAEDRAPGNAAAVAKARLVLSICEPSIEGQRGHDRAVVAARRAYDCGINVDQTFESLQVWNQRCKPPWSEAELWHKASQAPGFSA